MENTAQIKNPNQLKYVFDLKGSLVNRNVEKQEKPSTTLKDQNFIDMGIKTDFGPNKQNILFTIRNDVELLRSLNIMDYSLLLIAENKQSNKADSSHQFENEKISKLKLKGSAYVIKELTEQEEVGFFKKLGSKILKDLDEDPIDKSITLRV